MLYDLDVQFDSGNQALIDSLTGKLKASDGCSSVKITQTGTHNKIVATFEKEEQAIVRRNSILATSIPLFPKFKIIVEEKGFSLL